ncbi:MAG: peptidylprolyl isomerase [Anaerolineales bacterium]|nr:peptidylprolyl isomerase [Anaerolineae bacterium]PWB75055.1 MAG: peptidylprolyl isomerase [Anaerolineales bacterium]
MKLIIREGFGNSLGKRVKCWDLPASHIHADRMKGNGMSKDSVQTGVVVAMEYTLKIDGEVIDSSQGQDPLEFLTGHGNIISGLEREMIGMKVGESKDVVVVPADGYGEYDEEAYLDVPSQQFPKDMKVEEGLELTVRDDSGQARYARIESVEGETVRLNFNHPLAGDELHFNVKVVSLREPTSEELEHGHVHQGGHHH